MAITVFPGESYQAPRSWAERAYPNLTYFNKVDKGGHFAAWEEPELFATELRAAFRSLRQDPSNEVFSTVTPPKEVHMSATAPQAPGLTRTDIQEHDLSIPGRQVIQNRVDISPDAPVFRHKHPGEEVIYVLEGSLQYDIDGQPPIRVSAGEGLTVPADTVHAATNIGTRNAAELATYIVEKGKPFLVAAE